MPVWASPVEEACSASAFKAETQSLLQRKHSSVSEVDFDLHAGDLLAEELSTAAKELTGEERDRLQKLSERFRAEEKRVQSLVKDHGEAKPTRTESHRPADGEDGVFELCRAPTSNSLGQVAAGLNTSLHSAAASCADSEVVLFSPTDSSPYFETQCCPAGKDFCSGCSKMNAGRTACEVCSGGFTKTSGGNCVACVDLPGWVSKAGQNCAAASCSEDKFQGFSSKSACCKCGGGQKAATKFVYFVGPLAIGSTQMTGFPVPRTAGHYSVDKDCELAEYGLSISPTTGALQLAPGCNEVGCGKKETIEVKCTIFAEQEAGLTAQATLEVLAGDVSYGSAPVVLHSGATSSATPALNSDQAASGSFQGLTCVPDDASSWLDLDSGTGVLSLKSGAVPAGGVAGAKGTKLGQGGVCSVKKGSAKGGVVVLVPTPWTSMTYSYGSEVFYATVGEKSPVLSPKAGGDGLPPTRFSADCPGPAFSFDILSGVATWEGHQIFTLDVASGQLQLSPEESLTQVLDAAADSAVRRTVGPLQCTIFGHYEWAPLGRGPVLTHRVSVELRDHTCWAQKSVSFASRVDKGHASHNACRSKCRGEPYCTHWASDGGKCFFYSGLCKSSQVDDFACVYKSVAVTERYPGCGERHSCVDIRLPNHHYASGKYCPGGENVASTAQGPVFFKKGLTTEESFWLIRHDSSRSQCSSGDWVIVKPKPNQDYENETMGYVELHGDTLACVKGSSADLPTDIFGQPRVDLTVTHLSVPGATATVAAPGCVAPNVTVVEGDDDEGAVEVLVLDDPATDVEDDHWLHPCECVPAHWGSLPPVSGESVGDVPAGSNNEFMSGPAVIVDGQFVCEQEYLAQVIVETESDGLDAGNCKARCIAQECPYYWEGEVMSTKQCRIYSRCTELVREVGVVGILYGMTYRKACKVADPATCWKVTKRRSFLGAGDDSYACFHQDLVEQCDHKLMLGGLGISGCGHCDYAPVRGRMLRASDGRCADVDGNNNLLVHPCHGGDNQRFYFEGEALKPQGSNLCWDYYTGAGNVYLHPCHGGANQKWYWDGVHLRSRADDRCLDFQPGDDNMYVGNCPWSNTLLWAWKHNVHGGQQVANDHNHKCWTHDKTNNNVFVGDCSVAMKNRFFWDGERLKSETDSALCLDASSNGNLYMHRCHGGNNQKWYFDGKLLKSRDDGRCVDFQFMVTNGNLFRANCPDSTAKNWHWGPDVAKPLPHAKLMSQLDYLCVDYAYANTGKDVYMHNCHSGSNQVFYFDGEHLKNAYDGLCLDEPSDGSVYMHSCHNGDNQKWYFDNHRLKNRKWGDAKCLDYHPETKDLYMHTCHDGPHQRFNWEFPRRLKIRSNSNLCLDWIPDASNNVYMHPCHRHNNQKWYFHGPTLRSPHDSSKCLTMDGNNNNNLHVTDCHDADNQKFVWYGEQLKVRSNLNLCFDAASASHGYNVYMGPCHNGDNQKFYWDNHLEDGKTIRSENYCLDIDDTKTAVVHPCHENANQRFFFDGERLRVESDRDLCLDYITEKLYLHPCHHGNNQKFFFDGQNLRTRADSTCLDVKPNGQVYMGSCPNSNSLKWHFNSQLHNSVQLTVGGGRCLAMNPSDGNLEATGCGEEAQHMWYFHGDELKNEYSNKCVDYHPSNNNLYMHDCHGGNNQYWYWDGNRIRVRHSSNRCMDYQVNSGNVFAGTCPDQRNHHWEFEGGVALKKTPLPAQFHHGQSLRASCWSERFAAGSRSTETMTCVAGGWTNSQNKKGLDGFTCAACIQVVSKLYADLDAQIRQELFFARGMQLQLAVDTRTRRTVTSSGGLRAGGGADIFVAELMPDAAETMRRYRSLTNAGQCLKAQTLRIAGSTCAREAEPDQMMEAVELGSLLWDEFQAGANVPGKSSAGLLNRGSAPTTLRSFQLDASCGDHVMASIGLSHNSHLGMSATCTAASTYGAAVEHTIPLPGSISITSISEGTCMGIHHIAPWRLVIRHNNQCLDYNTVAGNGNVYMHDCHHALNQQWYMLDGNIMSLFDGKCLDYHTGTRNVYMHECHDGANQKWYWDEDTAQLRSEFDHQCLDMVLDGSRNIYMHACHNGNNQKFDRSEYQQNAFTMALHLDCSESVQEEITVEPIGNEAKFHLRRSPYTLPGEFRWDQGQKKIINAGNGKCLEARGRGRVEEVSCAERIEQEWIMSHGLPGLVDASLTCPGDQVLSYVRKTASELKFKCSHVSSLGACSPHYSTQVETKSADLEHIKALRKLGGFCPPGEGLKSLETEASDKGNWIRFKYACCQISRVPVSIFPFLGNGDKRAFDTEMAQGWEGVYCPNSRDNSGRMTFSQRRSFRPGHGAHSTLTYDKHQGNWCVSGKGCADSDAVHPLETSLHTDEWYAVPVSDFDAIFEAKGAKPLGAATRRKPPPLIKFGASDPDYLPECKDESHPGARKFKLADMNAEAKNLDDENPCKYVYGVPPTNQKMKDADGMTGWIDDLVGTIGPGQGGVTYKSMKECSDRDIVRELKMAKWTKEYNDDVLPMDFLKDMLAGYADGIPDVTAAPMGAGFSFQPGSTLNLFGTMYLNGIRMGFDDQIANRERRFEQAGHDDCNPIQHGFARTFCDLHCIRDAVRKGDDAILRALEEAVEIVGKNTQILLEHYVGEDSGVSLGEEAADLRRGVAAQLTELTALAQEATLQPRASLAAERAVRSFSERSWAMAAGGANASEGLHSLRTLSRDVSELHSTVMALSDKRLSRAEEVQKSSLEMASYMNDFLQAHAHVLGLYHESSGRGKRVQRWLKSHLQSKFSLMAELREARVAQALESFDTMWWAIRRKLDGYLEAAGEHAEATRKAVDALRGYTSRCRVSFPQLKEAYSTSARAERKAHDVLKKTWSEVTYQAGMLASRVVDGGLLDQLALEDVKAAETIDASEAEINAFCANGGSAALKHMRAHLQKVTGRGFLGQTQRQIRVLFSEMEMLQHRFKAAGLGPAPHAEVAQEAGTRLEEAAAAAQSAANHLAKDIAEHWQQHLCGGVSQFIRMLW